jgi:3-keto-5-aminohexanoate cleavage enzyme
MFELTSEPLIISCAITGNRTTREMNPNLPLTPVEQGIAAAEAIEAGASVIHLHVRNDDGSESHELDRFRAAVYEIQKRAPEAIIEVSTRGAVGEDIDYRGNCLELQTEMCSLNIGSLNIGDEVFLNDPLDVRKLADRIYHYGVEPEIDIFDVGMLENALLLKKKGVIRGPLRLLVVLGIPGGATAGYLNLVHMVNLIPPGVHWSALGIGRFQLAIAIQAVIMGGHARVGMEDTAFYRKGELAKSNAQLVERVARLSRELGREVATPDQARAMLGLKPRVTGNGIVLPATGLPSTVTTAAPN